MTPAQQEIAEACPAKAQQHPQTKGTALQGRPLPTKPKIICERKLWHLDELLINTQATCAIEANVGSLVGIANPSTHRRSDILDCSLFSVAMPPLLSHRLCSTVGAGHAAVG